MNAARDSSVRRFRHGPPADEAARGRIRRELDLNLLVEAGAGSGKTTMLVERMLELLSSGTAQVADIAAVTFTRKAAGELRQRLQQALEQAVGTLPAGDPALERVRTALDDLDALFAGTIHSFCARLLRERPLEAGIDPGFRELVTAELVSMARTFWRGFLERQAAEGEPLLLDLERTGVRATQLRGLFETLIDNLDVEFPIDPVAPPSDLEVAGLRRDVSDFLDRALAILPDREPSPGWDRFQQLVRDLRFRRRFPGWDDTPDFMDDLDRICRPEPGITLNRWLDRGLARALRDELRVFGDPEGVARRAVQRWWAHRYPPAVALALKAAEEFRGYRRLSGVLSFQDLLEGATRLLRERPEARRDLGERYRRLLVDEFQDTDPIQAELLLLLSSDPDSGARWDEVVPRPGALFVVGDPKQSIYRFRRADIALYGRVKKRFRAFGDVVELTANFRCDPSLAAFANGVFQTADGFPFQETEAQARFSPLEAMRAPGGEGPWAYPVPGDRREDVALEDAVRVASHIAREVERGRSPADFLVLTRARRNLALYARELEARNLPVQVSGAGVGVEEELSELILLMEVLGDPDDAVRTVAALTGLFLGVDHQSLLDFRMAGGSLDVRRRHPEAGEGQAAARALNRLNEWWEMSRKDPADVLLSTLAGELGLLPWAAAGELGSLRAGAMAYALDAVRAAAAAGETSLPGALEALRTALKVDEAETPLEPLREEAVRVMNLHQAKGLEAAVVILAEPAGAWSPDPVLLVERGGRGALGWVSVEESTGGFSSRVLARPIDWEVRSERGRSFERAEVVRLLYVAATRARESLLVSFPTSRRPASPWRLLDAALRGEGLVRDLSPEAAPGRERLDTRWEEIEATARDAVGRVAEAASPTYLVVPVTAVVRGGQDRRHRPSPPPRGILIPEPDPPGGGARGPEWGSVVHGLLALAGRGLKGEALKGLARSLLLEAERPIGGDGEPLELSELLAVVDDVMRSALWARAHKAPVRLAEVPFAIPVERIRGALPGDWEEPSPLPAVVEGVVDLAFRESGEWVVADWKTDLGEAAAAPGRLAAYRRQVDIYAACWEALTGESVKERVLLFTRTGREERW